MVATVDAARADNDELWDLYPAAIVFGQFNGAGDLVAVDIIRWPDYAAGEKALDGQQFGLLVKDGEAEVRWTLAGGETATVQAGGDWSWQPLFEETFTTAACSFRYEQALGARSLEGGEGYQLSQREILAWEGGEDVCPERVRRYLEALGGNPIMPAHLGDWQSLGNPEKPAESGRFEMQIWHDLRRTRRLLPFPATADAGADPVEAALGAVAPAPERFGVIEARLGPVVLKDGLEAP